MELLVTEMGRAVAFYLLDEDVIKRVHTITSSKLVLCSGLKRVFILTIPQDLLPFSLVGLCQEPKRPKGGVSEKMTMRAETRLQLRGQRHQSANTNQLVNTFVLRCQVSGRDVSFT